jgi:hypothetical protein
VLFPPHEHFPRECRGGRRCDGDADAELTRFVDQIEKIGASQRIASGQNQLWQRVAELPNLAQKGNALLEPEFHGMWRRNSLGAAVPACQRARLRGVPINIEPSPRVIAWRVVRGGTMAGTCHVSSLLPV